MNKGITWGDVNVISKPSIIGCVIETIIDYCLYEIVDDKDQVNTIYKLRDIEYATQVSMIGDLYINWYAVFEDMLGGSHNYSYCNELVYDYIVENYIY